MRRSTLSGLFGFFALLLALTADLSAAYQEPPFKLETGWLPEHETFLIWYAKQKGWDKQEGLDIVLNRFDSGKDLIGNADKWVIGACGAFPILTSHYPEQFTIIGVGNDESLANAVMVRPDSPLLDTKGANKGYPNLYGKADDVRGKTIICPASSSAQYLLTKWLAAYGLTTEDVRIQNTDAVPGLQAFFEGEGDAIVLWAPYSYTGDEHGLKVAATSRSVNAPQSVLLMADKDFAAAHPSQVASFLRVYLRAVRMMREESVATLAEDYKTFFKEWAGKTMSDAEVIKDITIHQVFLLEDQLRMFNAEHSRSDMQDWLASIIRFHAGDAYSRDKTEELLGLVTGAFLEKVERPTPSTANPAPPQRALPFPLSIRGNAIWKSRASEPLPIHASGFGPLFPCNTREALLSPEEQPPHRNQNVSPILIKKRPDPFLLDQAVFFFFLYGNERQPKSCPPLPTFPLNTPAGSRDEGTPAVQPPRQSKASGKEGGRGRKRLLQKGLPPPVSLLHLTSTRHLPSP